MCCNIYGPKYTYFQLNFYDSKIVVNTIENDSRFGRSSDENLEQLFQVPRIRSRMVGE